MYLIYIYMHIYVNITKFPWTNKIVQNLIEFD